MKSLNQYNSRRLNVDNLEEFEQIAKHRSGNAFCYIYEDENTMISFIWAQINTSNPEILEIISLWTSEKYRKQGFATSLKNILENWARKKCQIKKISTMVSTKNKAMLELNKKLKYRTTSYNMLKLLE